MGGPETPAIGWLARLKGGGEMRRRDVRGEGEGGARI